MGPLYPADAPPKRRARRRSAPATQPHGTGAAGGSVSPTGPRGRRGSVRVVQPGEPAPETLAAPAPTAVTPPGNPVGTWAPTVDAAGIRTHDQLAAGRAPRMVVVSAHPDDETLGAGRLLGDWSRRGGSVAAVTLTAGEACVDHVTARPVGLAARRMGEWARAMQVLGSAPEPFEQVPDGHVAEATDEVAARLATRLRPGDVLLAPWRHDPHPDHAAAGLAARRAARLVGATVWEYPVWTTYWQPPTVLEHTAYRLVRVPHTPAAEAARRRALACYRSQLRPLRAGLAPVVPPAMLAHHPCQLLLEPTAETGDTDA